MTKKFDVNHEPKEKKEQTEEELVDRLATSFENLTDAIEEFSTNIHHWHQEWLDKSDELIKALKENTNGSKSNAPE